MRRRIGLWALVGFIVACAWVILSFAIPISLHPILWGLARLTCPIASISIAFHFPVSWYWSLAANVATYSLMGLTFEGLHYVLHCTIWR